LPAPCEIGGAGRTVTAIQGFAIYLNWKRKQPADSLWQRRLKVMLDGVTWDRVEHAWAAGAALAARVMDTGGSRAVLSSDGWMVE
jgi:hypothetical protein